MINENEINECIIELSTKLKNIQKVDNESIKKLKSNIKYWECRLALIDHQFMDEFPLNRYQCLEYIFDYDAEFR